MCCYAVARVLGGGGGGLLGWFGQLLYCCYEVRNR